ncbi:MAG: MogA/MoaB family molybdenum cofactor biosynthesis protein [Dehalococcoidales bacterium]|nr:MogA/MoaB family molybdenum cofactor biosynthesis protein [Dehalococcoidales bacterium]
MYNAGVLTISDKGSHGERVDESGRLIRELITAAGCHVAHHEIVPDERPLIDDILTEWADEYNLDLIITTGGTGLGPRDVTPEATLSVVEKIVPGLAEAMRAQTFAAAPTSILSRAMAGVRGKCLIINLPGSPNGVQECLNVVLPVIPHAIDTIKGTITEHQPAGSKKGAH